MAAILEFMVNDEYLWMYMERLCDLDNKTSENPSKLKAKRQNMCILGIFGSHFEFWRPS